MDEATTALIGAILGQYALLIHLIRQVSAFNEWKTQIKEWRADIETRIRALELKTATGAR